MCLIVNKSSLIRLHFLYTKHLFISLLIFGVRYCSFTQRRIRERFYCTLTVLSVWFAVRCVSGRSTHSGCDSHQSRLTDVIMNLFLSHSPRLGHFQRAKRFAGAVGNGGPLKADSSGTWELGHAHTHCDELMLWHLPFLQALHKSRGALLHHRIQFHTPVGFLITLPNSD